MQQFAASQLALLNSLFAAQGDIPGDWLRDGTVKYIKLDPTTLNAALDGRYIKLVTAFGGHVTGVYSNLRIVLPTGGYINFDGTENNVVAIGATAAGIRIGNPTASNYLLVEPDGTLQFVGTAAVWDDLRFPATGINPPGAASDPARNTTTGLLEFSASATNIIAGLAQLSHKWKEGSDLSPHIHWMGFTTPGVNTDVVWLMEAEIVPIGGTWDGATYSYSSQVTASVTEDEHLLTPFTDIDMSAYSGVSICIPWKLSRLGAVAGDTYAAVATLLEVDIHYQIDTVGSRQEWVK